MTCRPPRYTLFPYTTLFRSAEVIDVASPSIRVHGFIGRAGLSRQTRTQQLVFVNGRAIESSLITAGIREGYRSEEHTLNSSHTVISYAVFCLKKKRKTESLT